jgi:putrescine transport system ATP-binding protein
LAEAGALAVEGLTKRFGATPVLDRLDLSIPAGSFVALLGASGSGKTTLLRLIAGLEEPDGGRILLDGEDLAGLPAYERPVNLVFQSYALFPHMSVAGNIAYGLRRESLGGEEVRRRVAETLKLVRLEGFQDRRPRQLSGGQAQRVALARVLAKRPRLLLLDEPMAALDRGLREHTRSELKRLHRELGTTFVLVTHDQEEALAMADRVALLEDGRLVQMGAPEDLYERPETLSVARFVGRINLLAGRAAGQGTMEVPVLGRVQIPAAIFQPGSALTLAIRPERIERGTFGPNVWPARVVDVTFLGDQMLYDMRLPGDIPLKALWPARSGAVARPGETITVGWPIAAALVFPE